MALDQSTIDSAGLGSVDPWLAGLEKRYDTAVKQLGTDVTKQEAATKEQQRIARESGAAQEKVGQKMLETVRAAPDPTTVKEERMPDYQRPGLNQQDLQSTFAALMVASMFAGKASRSPYSNAMTAMTGAMNGFMKEDDRLVKQSLDVFDRNLAAIKERNQALQRDMEANWKKNRNDLQAYQIESDLIRARYGVEQDAYGFEAKSLADRVKYDEQVIKGSEAALDRAMTVKAQLAEKAEALTERKRHDKELELIARENANTRRAVAEKKVTATQAQAAGGDNIAWSPEEVDFWAMSDLYGNRTWRQGLGRTKSGSENIQRVDKRVATLAKELGITPAQMGTTVSMGKAVDASLKQLTIREGALEQSSKKIDKDITTLDGFLESGTAGSVRLINKPINKIREAFSSPELSELMLAAQIVGTEYERMINGGLLSAAQLHEGAREDAHRLLNADMTPEQMRRIVKLMRSEIDNQRSAFKEQVNETVQNRTNILARVQAAGGGSPAAPVAAAGGGGWTPEKEKRLQELRAKRDGAQ